MVRPRRKVLAVNDAPSAPIAVLTGDVVDSSRLTGDARTRLLEVLKGLTPVVRELAPGAVPLPIDVYGGDSWQLVLTRPSSALRIALLVRATLLAEVDPEGTDPVDTRIVIARGGADFLSTERVSESEGEAFRLSGRTLADLSGRRMAFVVAGRSHLSDWDVAVRLLDTLVQDWTAKQARTMVGALQGWRQDEIAALWSPRIAQPSVAGHLRAARWDAVDAAVRAFETRLRALEEA